MMFMHKLSQRLARLWPTGVILTLAAVACEKALLTGSGIPPAVASVAVSPSVVSVLVGATAQLTATLTDPAGNTLAGRTITWESSAPGVASVSGSGLVTGVGAGPATITATSEGQSGTSAVTVVTPPPPGTHTGWYVTPTGSSSGAGSSTSPWDLQTALSGGTGKIMPGDTVWLRAGRYGGAALSSSLQGAAGAPIVVRQYPGERATLDANGTTSTTTRGDYFVVNGNYVTFWGFEVMDSDPNARTTATRPNLLVANASHLKFINLVVHDGGIGLYTWPSPVDIEVYGCLFYNNGWQQPDFGNGHGMYVKSYTGPLYLRDNIVFNQFGYGIHAYTEAGTGGETNVHIEGNALFNNGAVDTDPVNSPNANILFGGNQPVQNSTLLNNMTFFSPNVGVRNIVLGWGTLANVDLTAQNNYAVGGQTVFEVHYWQALTMSGNAAFGSTSNPVNLMDPTTTGFQLAGNQYYRDPAALAWIYNGSRFTFSGWQTATGVGATDQARAASPTQPQVFVRPSGYELGRGNVIVYNWNRQAAVPVDLSTVLQAGARYEIRNVQDFFGTPVVSGTYGGGTVSIPMTGVTAVAPIGGSPTQPPTTGPDFNVFVVITLP